MKKYIYIIFITTLLTNSIALADNPYCSRENLKKLSDIYTTTLLCGTLAEDSFKECTEFFITFGVSAAIIGATGTQIRHANIQWAASDALKAEKLRGKFSKETLRLLNEMANEKDLIKNSNKVIAELSKHPRLFNNILVRFQQTNRLSKLLRLIKYGGVLTGLGAFIEGAVLTPPEDCEKLTFDGIKKQDMKWISFGMNCRKNINANFLGLEIDEQLKIMHRSPDLCHASVRFEKDLGEILNEMNKHPQGVSEDAPKNAR